MRTERSGGQDSIGDRRHTPGHAPKQISQREFAHIFLDFPKNWRTSTFMTNFPYYLLVCTRSLRERHFRYQQNLQFWEVIKLDGDLIPRLGVETSPAVAKKLVELLFNRLLLAFFALFLWCLLLLSFLSLHFSKIVDPYSLLSE